MRGILNKKRCLIIIVLGLLTMNLCLPLGNSSDGAEIVDLFIHTPTGESIVRYDNPVWIRGIWHYANITLNVEANKVSIIFYHGDTPLQIGDRDETNYYNWKYDHGSWWDVQHDSRYIENDYCDHDIDFYSFYIGIDQYAESGNWTLVVLIDDEQLLSKRVIVDKEVSSLVLRSVPVTLRVEPFTEDDFISEEKFIVENKGNVPLRLSINYGSYNNIFSTLDFNEILKVDQIRGYSILVHSKSSWKPGTITIKSGEVSVTGEIDYVIPPKNDVSLIPSNLSLGLGITVFIGHSGYELEQLANDIAFQYMKNLEIKLGETKDVFAYISGKGNITVDITSKNLKILKIFGKGVEVKTPFIVRSNNTSEYPITIQVRGIVANTTAFLYYYLEIGGKTQTYTTKINVGPPSSQVEDTTSIIMSITAMIVTICIVLSIVLIIQVQIKHRRK